MRWLLTHTKLGLVKFAITIAVESQDRVHVLACKVTEAILGMSGERHPLFYI